MRTAVAILTLVVAAGFVAMGVVSAVDGHRAFAAEVLSVVEKDHSAQPFELIDFLGNKRALQSSQAKVILVNFWATWCAPCREEMPSLGRFASQVREDTRIELLAISVDEDWEAVRAFFGKTPPSFPVLLDPKGELAKKYGTTIFPETYVIVDGRVRGFIEGPRTWDAWYTKAYVDGLLRESM